MTGWPWPLGGIQTWFENLWGWISEAAAAAVSIVSDWINDAISGLWTTVSGAFTSLWDSVSGALGGLWDSIVEGLGGLWTSISEGLGGLWTSISTGLGDLWTSVSGAVSDLWTGISDTFAGLWTSISEGLGSLWTSISESVGGLASLLSTGLSNLWTGFVEWGGNLVSSITTMFDGALSAIGGWVSNALAGVAKALGEALSGFIGWIQEQFNTLVGWLVGGIQWLGTQLRSIFEALATMILAPVTEALKPGSPPEPLGAAAADFGSTLMNNIVEQCKKIHKSPAQRELAVGAGAAVLGGIALMHSVGGALTMAFDATHPAKQWGTQELLHRVVLNLMGSPVTSAILATPVLIGIVTPMRQYFNAMFQTAIPSYADMIRIYVREGYLPEYQAEIPAGMIEDFKLLGYSEYWTKSLWGAHWVLPSTGQVFEMLHRGIITDEIMRSYLKTADILAVWRDRLIAISWDLPGRIDARWMAGWGLIDVDEYGDLLVKRGLDPAWRDRVAEATIKQQMASEINKLRDNAKKDLVDGFITEDVLRADLRELGFPEDRIDYHVADAMADRARQHKKRLLEIYEDYYVKGIPTEPPFEEAVREILVDEEAADLFIEEATIKKLGKKGGAVAG